ncbi:hypothetical protein DTO045G8_8771 [Paecilomyces variotii]|nr:hypothetical protein DTO045G8_8771 [Paecilomyces variotii]
MDTGAGNIRIPRTRHGSPASRSDAQFYGSGPGKTPILSYCRIGEGEKMLMALVKGWRIIPACSGQKEIVVCPSLAVRRNDGCQFLAEPVIDRTRNRQSSIIVLEKK